MSQFETKITDFVAKHNSVAPLDQLRSYQKRDYRDVLARCEKVRSVLYVAFMGSGKTVLAAALIRTWADRGERVLIVTHTREILRQTDEKLRAAGIDESRVGWIWRQHPRTNPDAPIQLASLDTLTRRSVLNGITRLVIDEAHHAVAKKWRDVIDAYPDARVLGLTGTPVRLDGRPLGDVFDEMVESDPVESLIDQRWIAQPAYWTPDWQADLSRRSGSDFGDEVAAEMMSHPIVLKNMVAEYRNHAAGMPALGFAATREKATEYARYFSEAGIAADTVFGADTDLKRQGTLARLRKGALSVLWTCNVLGEGWDYSGLRCVLLARPTVSLARYLQQVARCMRPGPPPVVLDLWGAWSVFDPPWADFGWSLQGKPRSGRYAGRRNMNGSVEWSPPVEVDGQLIRADALSVAMCAVCGAPATKASAYNARVRNGYKPYCAAHRGGPSAQKPRLPCAICHEPATRTSSSNARSRGTKPYCAKHVAANRAAPRELVKSTTAMCAVCGAPATKSSAKTARVYGFKPYCKTHSGGAAHPKPLLPCATCGDPATAGSSASARLRDNGKAYCAEHTGGPSAKRATVPCAACGAPATRRSAASSKQTGCKPYCADHLGGPSAKKPLLPCAVCGRPATRSSSNIARRCVGKAYCEEHAGGPNVKRPRLPCVVCGRPATSVSSLYVSVHGGKSYCRGHAST